jgi:AcrR family transcriptional regulator
MKVAKRLRLEPAERRAQIVDEAIRFVGEKGYHGFTIQELARRCGITNGALLHYFESKEGLLSAVLEERDRREEENVLAVARDAARDAKRTHASLESVLKLTTAIIDRAAAEPELSRLYIVLQAEAMDRSHPAHDYFARREKLVFDALELMAKPHVEDASGVAREMFAMMDGLTLRRVRSDQGFDLRLAWDGAARKLLPVHGARGVRRRYTRKQSQTA